MTKARTELLFTVDLLLVVFSLIAAYLFRFDFDLLHKINLQHAFHILALTLAVYLSMFFVFKMHRIIWRYASLNEMVRLSKSVLIGFVICMAITYTFFGFHYVPLSILPLQAFFYLALLVLSRGAYRIYRSSNTAEVQSNQVLIIGAGQAAEGLIRDMLHHAQRGYKPVALLDDDKSLHGRSLHGVKVRGYCRQLKDFIDQLAVDMVVVAIPSLHDNNLLNNVVKMCGDKNIEVRVLPGLSHLADGRVNIDALKSVDIEDLLGREPISILNTKLMECLHTKTVLVTGGGGSIGSELCRQIAVNRPDRLCIVDHSEFNLYTIHRELSTKFPTLEFIIRLIDVSNLYEMARCINDIRPHIIFHAAAYKHVPMLEDQAATAVKNNVLSTRNLADLSNEYGVEHFILVSTDKAVNPTNIMGMTKRLGEIYCQNMNARSKTNFITVRFGNVLGSAGSVLPLFRQQLAKGGPLTVTDKRMTRYFMMIPEAVNLILQSFFIGDGGEIFVLDMGESVKIVDLAEKLISLSGKTPYKQIDIKFTGIRPGEKLYEEIFHDAEQLDATSNEQIFKSSSRECSWEMVSDVFKSIEHYYQGNNVAAMLQKMLELVPEYEGKHAQEHV